MAITKQRNDKRIIALVPSAIYNEAEQMAQADSTSLSRLARVAVQEFVARRRSGEGRHAGGGTANAKG